ncbi:MAG: dienelactone hydrolase family protein, partial [Chloroflexota bacterium]
MPIHDSGRVEFAIDSGNITLITDEGKRFPAYWAHPRIGHRFSGICMLHDWWGMNNVSRLLANFFARMGYYVIAPDMFGGQVANTPQTAMRLLERTENTRFAAVDATVSVLESHHRINESVAVVGVGMGGTLAFEAAIKRDDLEAAVAYAGFPNQYMGTFAQSNTPILAIYGENEPYIKSPVVAHLHNELKQTAIAEHHRVEIIAGGGHELFSADPFDKRRDVSKHAINHTLAFLDQHLE